MITLAADIGGTRIKLALMRDQSALGQQSIAAHSEDGLAPQLPRIVSGFKDLCSKAEVQLSECGALAIAFPSLVDIDANVVTTAYGKYTDASQLNLTRWARDSLHVPLVLENDARAALLGEWKSGAGSGCNDLVMVTLGTGLGTAALINGHILRGRHGQAGVLGGHFTIRQGGYLCTCGNRGCAEAEASTSVLPLIARADFAFSASTLQRLVVIDYSSVFRLAREGDRCAMALRTRAIEVWSALIVNLIHAYDPERVIVGGGIVAGAEDFFADLERQIHLHAYTPWGRVQIVPAQLGDAAALFGGEILVRERIFGIR